MAPFPIRIRLIAAVLVLSAVACSVPGASPTAAPTAPVRITSAGPTPVSAGSPTSVIAEVRTNTPGPTPTRTPIPSNTPVIGSGAPPAGSTTAGAPQADCTNDSDFVADVTIPDGTRIPMGERFMKTWRLRNSGTCTWGAGYMFVLIENSNGLTPATDSQALPLAEPGQTIEVSLQMRLGTGLRVGDDLRATFQIEAPSGERFGTQPYVLIEVGPPPGQGGTAAISGVVWRDYCSPGGMVEGTLREQKGSCLEDPVKGQIADGIRQPTEQGIAGVLVELHSDSCAGPVYVQGPTQSDGAYTFTQLPAGIYCVMVDPRHNTNESILIPGGFTAPADGTNYRIATITSGEIKTGVDFGWDDQFD